jgi:hypothetical protein
VSDARGRGRENWTETELCEGTEVEGETNRGETAARAASGGDCATGVEVASRIPRLLSVGLGATHSRTASSFPVY